MSQQTLNYSIIDKLNFERRPVGIKFTMKKPEDIEPLDRPLALCEMFKEAQTSKPFYGTRETLQCGEHVVGYEEFPPIMYSGQLGRHFAMFKNQAANRRIYDYVPIMPKDSVDYIIHSSYDQMTFEPDIMIFTADARQGEILLKVPHFTSSYADGKMWNFKGSTCLACAWLYAYPYLNGELNCCVSGLGFSMKARQVLPDGLLMIAVPWNLLPGLLDNLEEMEWEPRWFSLGRDGFIEAVKQLDEDILKDING